MPTIINGTTGIDTVQDGVVTPSDLSAGAPTWSPTGGVSLPRIDSTNEGGQLNFNRASDNTATWSIDSFGNTSTPSLRFIDGANVRAVIDGSGNVGIGTSSPSQRVDVAGNVKVNGASNGNVANAILTRTDSSWRIANETDFRVYNSTSNTDNPSTMIFEANTNGNFRFNSGYGSVATAYGCRAWVNFNGTGTVAIRASGNVSSITDNGTGDYTVNFTNALADANYSCNATSSWDSGTRPGWIGIKQDTAPTTSAIRLLQMRPSDYVAQDAFYASVAIFR